MPSSVVREELDERVAELEAKESRKIGSKEKKELREQIEFELLPQAFTRTKKLDAWLDTQQHGLLNRNLKELPFAQQDADREQEWAEMVAQAKVNRQPRSACRSASPGAGDALDGNP